MIIFYTTFYWGLNFLLDGFTIYLLEGEIKTPFPLIFGNNMYTRIFFANLG